MVSQHHQKVPLGKKRITTPFASLEVLLDLFHIARRQLAVEIGMDVFYDCRAVVHQFGGKRGRKPFGDYR